MNSISSYIYHAGADPGIFVRGGPTFWKFLTSKKKKNTTKRGEGGGFSMVVDIPRCFLQAKTHSRWLFKLCKIGKCVSYKLCHSGGGGGGVLVVLPQNFFGLNGVKSCVLDKINIAMALSWKPVIVCMMGERITILKLEVIQIFQIFTYRRMSKYRSIPWK